MIFKICQETIPSNGTNWDEFSEHQQQPSIKKRTISNV